VDTLAPAPIRARGPEEGALQISWLDALLSLAVLGVCLFSGLEALGLTGPDEPRYAAIARTMARTGDWVTPRLAGEPWLEKPALYYWVAASAMRLFGEGEFAARLPSALAALLAILVTAWGALRAYGIDTARLTVLMLPTTIAMIGFSHAAAPDMLFSGLLAAAAVAAAEMLQKPRPRTLDGITFGALLGAATLAKGPAALLLAGIATLLWSLASRRSGAAFRFLHPACWIALAVVALPWYALCAARNPEFFRIFFLEHNFQRFLTPVFQHPQPFWFFGPVLLAAIFPWTALVLPLGLDAFRARTSGHWRSSPSLLFACWAVAPLLFFSFSESKLPGYILPSVPPLILLLAATMAQRLSRGVGRARGWIILVAITLPLVALSGSYWLRRLPAESGLTMANQRDALLLAAVGGLGCALLAWARKSRAALLGLALLMAGLVARAALVTLPRLDPYLSARPAARITAQILGAEAPVSIFGVDRYLEFGLDYYLQRSVPQWAGAPTRPAWIWTTATRAAELQRQGLRFTVLQMVSRDAWLLRLEGASDP
jgi:4-amino-4-deoxy-L-arabinose transferase-like glycosyltransferase